MRGKREEGGLCKGRGEYWSIQLLCEQMLLVGRTLSQQAKKESVGGARIKEDKT